MGRGVAAGGWENFGGRSSASASVNSDGTVSLVEGSTDIGSSRTSIAMQLAETMQIPAADIKPFVTDTEKAISTNRTQSCYEQSKNAIVIMSEMIPSGDTETT